jgi:hypothetical protein
MSIVQITSIAEKSSIKILYDKVFNSNDPMGEIFQDDVAYRLLICPIPSPFLDEELLQAAAYAAKLVGDEYFYLSEVEGKSIQSFHDENHWKIHVDVTYEEYTGTTPPILFENAIYSPSGLWGILVAHSDFAVLGGNEIFVNAIKEKYSNWVYGLDMFLKKWEFNAKHNIGDFRWMPTFFRHLKITHHFKQP